MIYYKGEYINLIREKIKNDFPNVWKRKDAKEIGKIAADIILEEMIKPSIVKMGIKFDVFFKESSLK
jgi:hypothetical protein